MAAILVASFIFIAIWLYKALERIGQSLRAQERAYKTQVDFKDEFNRFPKDRNFTEKGGK